MIGADTAQCRLDHPGSRCALREIDKISPLAERLTPCRHGLFVPEAILTGRSRSASWDSARDSQSSDDNSFFSTSSSRRLFRIAHSASLSGFGGRSPKPNDCGLFSTLPNAL